MQEHLQYRDLASRALRTWLLAMLAALVPYSVSGQAVGTLRIKVALTDAEQKSAPVPRHTLLVSDNPVSAPPRRVITGIDGTVETKLRPGNYTVESDRPVTFQGKAYQWIQMVDVVAGREAVLELTAGNAEVEAAASPTDTATHANTDPGFMETQWQHSVVGVWTPTTHGSGFVIDANGLIVTNQRGIDATASVEVQLSPTLKVVGSVLATDPTRDVAVLWIDPQTVASVPPVPIGCDRAATPPVDDGDEIFAIGVSLRQQQTRMTSGTVSRLDANAVVSDLMLPLGSAGGPVFTAGAAFLGITSLPGDKDDLRRGAVSVVRASHVCASVAAAKKKMSGATPPAGTALPLEPARPFPTDALQEAAKRRTAGSSPYQMSSSTFEIAFITPLLTYAAQQAPEPRPGRDGAADTRALLLDFRNWSGYVAEFPPVLLVRVTPKLVEGFWTTVARGAARTQGVSIPPIKHVKAGFSRLRAFCGDAEVTPIHPFKLEQRVSETDAIYEGLYVFDPGALKPECGSVKLELYSDKEPKKADTRMVDPKVIQQIWDDFAAYRRLPR